MGTKNKPGVFDCYDAAEDDEPMFVLLARDPDAPDRVEEWARRRFERLAREHTSVRYPEHESAAERERLLKVLRKIAEALQCAQAMREWKPKAPPIVPLLEPLPLRPWPTIYRDTRGSGEGSVKGAPNNWDMRGQGE